MKKYLSWIIEASIWVFVIIILIMCIFVYNHQKLKQKHSYHVFFSDTDGLRNGSPVKIMGNEIGYVSNVKVINNDEIFVSFVVTKPNITIPDGATVNIESTGIVGSRSLEIYPPQPKENNENNENVEADSSLELLTPHSPQRIQGAFKNSSQTAEIIYSAASTVNKAVSIEDIPVLKNFIHDTDKELNDFNPKIEQANDYQLEAIKAIKSNKKLNDFNKKMEKFIK